ncbi:HAD-IIA family hydrolase [Halobacterium litoreum]|uniref:HAD-IIA family hydrolase n=1 Tax=Halobacterium litoreum TaxID=2039234 RepID=A0ABD5NAI6_9EURY|nr:HAD-IIA family hydrolase [Halobacterium litoreum]UHH12105.1 HAD-IIA family hydrolase [Halobacterium litoreum]
MTYRGAVVDLDGTVVRGGDPIPGALDALTALRERVDRVLFLTNNPTVPPAEYARRLRALGADATAAEVLTATTATIHYLRERHAEDDVLPIAEESIAAQLRDAGLTLTDDAEAAGVVVAGYHREFHYRDLQTALDALDDDTALVGTDPDRTVPTESGRKPGSGAIVNAVAGVADREPEAVLGKPSETTARLAADRLGVPARECVLVGDRLDTDVAMGESVGMTTVLVRTGVDGDEEVSESEAKPDHVVDSLADVPALLG